MLTDIGMLTSFELSTDSKGPLETLDGDDLDVLFDKQYGLRSITLNRPKKLNALNGSMAKKILARLQVCIGFEHICEAISLLGILVPH